MVYKNKGFNAFTLAEILITLGIIGVVAAMTIPTIIQKQQEAATVSSLKKAYSILSSAYTRSVQDNGTPELWGITTDISPLSITMLEPYLRTIKVCIGNNVGCFPLGVSYIDLSGTRNDGVYASLQFSKMRLADGSTIMGLAWNLSTPCSMPEGPNGLKACARYYVDVNGNKAPNRIGIDTFKFYLTTKGIVPAGTPEEGTFDTGCKDKSTADGWGCAAWVIYNGNLDYLHCSNLSWTGKSSCN